MENQVLPAQVVKLVQDADALHKQLYPAVAPPVPGPTPDSVNTPPANPPVVAPAVDTPPQPPVVTPAPVEPVVTPTPSPAPAPCAECAKWQHKYDVLQGKYNAEVPRLTYQVAVMQNQIDDLRSKAQAVPPAQSMISTGTPSSPQNVTSSIADMLRSDNSEKMKNFRENYPDVFEMVTTVVDLASSKTQEENAKRLQAVEQNNATSQQARFLEDLTKAHPDWQTIAQGDPEWATWLGNTDRYTGLTRLELLIGNTKGFKISSVIAMFSDFKEEKAKRLQTPGNPPAPVNANPPAPNPAATVFPPSGPARPMQPGNSQVEYISGAFVKQFADDMVRGRYRGREKEAAEIQARINRAQVEGRIV